MKKNREYKNPLRVKNRTNRDSLKSLQVKNRMIVAARIDDIRVELGLSKSGFADLVEQKPSVITKWLSGTHNFTQDTYSLIEFKTKKKIFPKEEIEHENVILNVRFFEVSNEELERKKFPITPNPKEKYFNLRKFAGYA